MTQNARFEQRLMRMLHPQTCRPGLLSVSPLRGRSVRTAQQSVPRRPDFSPLNSRGYGEQSLKKALDFFYRVTGLETAQRLEVQNSAKDERKSEVLPDGPKDQSLKKRSKRCVFVHDDKEFLEKLNLTLQQMLQKKQEVEPPKPLSDVERLAIEAELQALSRPRGRTELRKAAGHSPDPLPTELAEKTVQIEQTVDTEAAIESEETTKATEADSSPDMCKTPMLQTKRLSIGEERMHLPPLSPLNAPSPQYRVRVVVDVPTFPFGKHKPIPEKVETMMLTPIELRIRRRKQLVQQQVKQLLAAIAASNSEL